MHSCVEVAGRIQFFKNGPGSLVYFPVVRYRNLFNDSLIALGLYDYFMYRKEVAG